MNNRKYIKPEIMDMEVLGVPFPISIRKATTDMPNFYETFISEDYYFEELNFVPNIILDCGAYIGLSAIYFKLQFPDSTIIAVEPAKSNFKMLKGNLSYYKTVFCLNKAIWNEDKSLVVSDERKLGHWGMTTSEITSSKRGNVKSITIRSLMDAYDITHIDLLKIDIEGSEIELFRSNYDYWLSRTKAIIIETHDRLRDNCTIFAIERLNAYDFSIVKKGNILYCLKRDKFGVI